MSQDTPQAESVQLVGTLAYSLMNEKRKLDGLQSTCCKAPQRYQTQVGQGIWQRRLPGAHLGWVFWGQLKSIELLPLPLQIAVVLQLGPQETAFRFVIIQWPDTRIIMVVAIRQSSLSNWKSRRAVNYNCARVKGCHTHSGKVRLRLVVWHIYDEDA